MKNVGIGISTMFAGLMIMMGIIVSASIYLLNVNGWSGNSKFWHVILGEPNASNSSNSFNLRVLFGAGKWLFLIGLVILAIEYFKESRTFKGFFKEEKKKDIKDGNITLEE